MPGAKATIPLPLPHEQRRQKNIHIKNKGHSTHNGEKRVKTIEIVAGVGEAREKQFFICCMV